jgi:hypothetical protein
MELEVYRTDSGFIVGLPQSEIKKVLKVSFQMACGEILNPGDKFTEIESKGSSGLPPIVLSEGWYQQYFGRIKFKDAAGEEKELALFDAFQVENGRSALENKRNSNPTLTWFIGYTIIGAQGELGYETRSRSIRVITCSGIVRYEALD